MKTLLQYITEGRKPAKHKVTDEWLKRMFKKFNKLYFNNELPNCELAVRSKESMGKSSWLGQFGFNENWYYRKSKMRNNKYIIYREKDDKEVTASNIDSMKPHIYMSSKYEYTWNQMEDTLIHEMIHWWTYKDGLAPKQGHGPEFRRKCDEIRTLAKANGKDYELTIYANRKDDYQLTAEEQQEAIIKANNQKKKSKLLYYEFDPTKISGINYRMTKRFGIYSNNSIDTIVSEIKFYDQKSVIAIYELSEETYDKLFKEFGHFQTCRSYRFWDATTGTYEILQKWVKEDKNKKVIYDASKD